VLSCERRESGGTGAILTSVRVRVFGVRVRLALGALYRDRTLLYWNVCYGVRDPPI
jgi:hypothetical protein